MRFQIHPVPIGVYQARAFVVRIHGGPWIAIDAAPPDLMRHAAGGGSPDFLILTHEHFDHIAGFVPAGAFEGIPLVASAACAERLSDPVHNLSRFDAEGRVLSVRPPDIPVPTEGLTLDWRGRAIELMPAPGHSPGGLLIHVQGNLFTGDTLLRDHRTVTKLPGGDRAALQKTLEWIFERFPGETAVWPGHGEPFRLSESSVRKALYGLNGGRP